MSSNDINTEIMITTVDNPINPFENFRDWYMFDMQHGYNTCGYLARITKMSDTMTSSEENEEIARAIDEIFKYNPLATELYKKVYRNEPQQA